ncbi:MAG: twin-arginine translocation signal domain-containing protein [Gemmatales bacterium]|nr:twin-arginine translocation signal domain-containing protein [Gemmatales bacterium]MDW7994536.1 twin-arginine translocation signal domain-containing protein [Gemmatales bacterium]
MARMESSRGLTAWTRREFLGQAAAGSLVGMTFLHRLPSVAAAQTQVARLMVQYPQEIEPLVRLIEETPRERLLEAVAQRIRAGTSYQQLLAALMLAGVRGIQPRPVGFKFHAVLVVNSAHLAAIAAADRDRWLPLFWALDYFKTAQERNRVEGDWRLPPPAEDHLPAPTRAKAEFLEAMEAWDEERADRAITALARSAGQAEISECFWRLAVRDFRDIGHKIIYAANAWRTLQVIGWRCAEPVLRSLAYALLDRGRDGGNPAQNDFPADRPGRANWKRIREIRDGWHTGKADAKAAAELVEALRTASPDEASAQVVRLLNAGVSPQSVYDGLFLAAGEWLARQPGIVGLHCVTMTNAMHFAFQNSGVDEHRRYILLQNAAFLAMFRDTMRQRGKLNETLRLDQLEPAPSEKTGSAAVEEIFDLVGRDTLLAARKTLAALQQGTVDPAALMAEARRLIFAKGFDSHDYKFSSAALEDFYHTSPAWRNRFLAAAMFNLKGTSHRDNQLIQRARAALGA